MIITLEELSRSIRKTLQIKEEVAVFIGDYESRPQCPCGNDEHMIMSWKAKESELTGQIIFHDEDFTMMDYTIDSGRLQ